MLHLRWWCYTSRDSRTRWKRLGRLVLVACLGKASEMVVREAEARGSGLHTILQMMGRSLVALLLIKSSGHNLRKKVLLVGSSLMLSYNLSRSRP